MVADSTWEKPLKMFKQDTQIGYVLWNGQLTIMMNISGT
jgi:hypothetical protein